MPEADTLYIKEFTPAPLQVSLVRSKRKTLAISVYPDLSVEAISPLASSTGDIVEKILKRRRWILRQQAYFKKLQSLAEPQLSLNGAETFYLGKQYRIKIYPCDQDRHASLQGRYLQVPVPDAKEHEIARIRITEWYRTRAKDYLSKRFEKVLSNHQHLKLPEVHLRVTLMKTRWGSCTASGTITLNPLLVLAASDLIDYVIVHELCHLKHPNHSKSFYQLMDKIQPDWKERKAKLDSFGAKLKSYPSPF
ncbi:hypothetical protein SAMN02745181_1274 [Rubritalea squalenifaciens DSM 18772]|uniref:YgjP-like metallopeptidase domain-containing protein n=1 Tax=Rubritalea squalenifaciens DSM 18772 TaxID=1123071 RepID=A0A1M6GUR6_9BACT|nr:SprT family zinc-dependent metalloprotease [Rubritalea squalenifaciens]SHJ13654.1 hypothetical protein SAMN02745181_1274 [Rubritalea squalenifaciens DSM 18772]